MPGHLSLRTDRLVLDPVVGPESADVLARISAAVYPDAPGDAIRRASEAAGRSAVAFAAHGYGLWLLVPLGRPSVVGWCGLKTGCDPGAPELTYGLLPDVRGAGLVSEAVRAVVAHALALPATRCVWGAARSENVRSLRVLDRAGMRLVGHRVLDDGERYVVYEATRSIHV
jgi:RimJ/RimL family protein N-acetyltransferase